MNGVERSRRLHLDEALTEVYESMIQRAKEGDPQAMKMVMEQAGRWKNEPDDETGVSDEDVEGSSNEKLAAMMASMLSGNGMGGEAAMQAKILKSLGEDVPAKLKRKVQTPDQGGRASDTSGQTDEDEASDEAEDPENEEQTPESEEETAHKDRSEEVEDGGQEVEDQTEEVEEADEFELENHLMEGMEEDDPDPFDPTEEVEDDGQEEEDLEELDSTEDFEIPLDW